MTTRYRRPESAFFLIAAAGVGLVMTASGCGRDAASEAVSKTTIESVKLVGHAGGEGTTANADKIYREIEGWLKDVEGKGSTGTSNAVSVLLSSARHGQASTLMDKAQEAGFKASEQITVVTALLSKWSRLTAQAEAAATVVVTGELGEIASLLTELDAQRRQHEIEKNRADARLADLQAQIADLLSRSQHERTEAGRLQLELPKVSATTAAQMAELIREHTLRGDGFEIEASRLEMDLRTAETTATEATLGVRQVQTQTDLLKQQRVEAQTRAADAREDERSAGEQAVGALDDLRAETDTLAAMFDGEIGPAFDKAVQMIRSSIQSAQQARAVARGNGALAAAVGQQALGQVERERAVLLLKGSELFAAIGGAGAIGTADEVTDELRSRAEAAHTASSEAFTAAAGALRRVQLKDDPGQSATQRLKDAAGMLERMAATKLGSVPNLEPEAVFEDDAPADEQGEPEDDWDMGDEEGG